MLFLFALWIVFICCKWEVVLVTHADGSRVSKAIIRVCVSVILSAILFVLSHDKTKTAENTIVKLGTLFALLF